MVDFLKRISFFVKVCVQPCEIIIHYITYHHATYDVSMHKLYMGLKMLKPVFRGLRTTKAQTNLSICAV